MIKRMSRLLLTFALLVWQIPQAAAESLNLTTYYPVPSGVYKNLTTTQGANFAVTSGNVGIGNVAPTQKLDVTGNAYFSGNVGIGIPSPTTKLDVNGTINALKVVSNTGSGGNWADISAPTYAAQTSIYSYGAICAGNAGGFCTGAGGVTMSAGGMVGTPSVALTGSGNSWFDGGGNLGIGNNAPIYKLDVSGNLNVNKGLTGGALFVNNSQALWFDGNYFSWGYDGNANYFADRVGIGITNPSNPLHVYGSNPSIHIEGDNGSNFVSLMLEPLDSINSYASLYYSRSGSDIVALDAPNFGNAQIRLSFSGIPIMTIDNNTDSVGIGTTNPTYKLDIPPDSQAVLGDMLIGSWPANGAYAFLGNRYLNQSAAGNYALLQGGAGDTFLNAAAGMAIYFRINNSTMMSIDAGGVRRSDGVCQFSCPSDRNLKNNIKPINNSLEKIAQLQPVTFEYKNTGLGKGIQTGLVAQDVEKIFPTWVNKNSEGFKTIGYGAEVQVHLIEAVKELKQNNDTLGQENQQLQKRLDKLEQRLERLDK
ncbi:MAG: tail fiber domain-containing protein [Elusimicrobiota bacterium]